MNNNFSKGVFININTPNKKKIDNEIKKIQLYKNLQHIEIWFDHPELNFNIFKYTIKKIPSKIKTIIHAPFITINLATYQLINNASIKILQNIYNWSNELNIPAVIFHSGKIPFFQDKKTSLRYLNDSLKKLSINKKTKLCLENMPKTKKGTLKSYPDSLLELTTIVNNNKQLFFCLDIGHVIQNNEKNYLIWLTQNKDKIIDIHFHDAIKNGPGHLELGTGDLKPEIFIKKLEEINYKNFLSLEVIGDQEKIISWQKYLN